MTRCSRAAVLATAFSSCLCCALVVAYSVVYFTGFTMQHNTDLHPCEMSYFHHVHFPTLVHSSTAAKSPTHDSRLNHHPSRTKKGKAQTADSPDEHGSHAHLYEADAAISNHSVAESVDAAHAAGYRMLRYHSTADDGPVTGLPVLFLHGSSGHYHQARSLFSRLDLIHQSLSTPPALRPSYFSLDFLEEKTAFSGALLLRQAHYTNEALRTIAYRYARDGLVFPGVAVVAHSMGGVVAHLLPLLCNYLPASVLAMYSLGGPHAAPVLVVDETMRAIYQALAAERLQGRHGPGPHLLSLAGGVNDFFIEPALTLLPAPWTVNTMAHAVPHVQTAVEHQSLCWCRQLMEAVGQSIVALAADPSAPTAPRALFVNPLHLPLQPVHQAIASGVLHLQAVLMQVRGRGTVAPLPTGTLLVLIDGRVASAALCAATGEGGVQECRDVTGRVQTTSALYRDETYPATAASARHLLFLEGVTASTALHLLASNTTQYPLTLPSITLAVLKSSPLRDGRLDAGVYHWAAYVPAGVDRYYAVAVHSPTPAPPVFFHFSSVPVDAAAAAGKDIAEDTFMPDGEYSTVVRFYRRPYQRWATAVLVVGGTGVEVSVTQSPYSWLRTVFLQLPLLPHFVLAAFLAVVAWQHWHLRVYGVFPHMWDVLTTVSPGSLAVGLVGLTGLFVATFPGTQFHAEAFLSPSALASSPSYSLWTLAVQSGWGRRVNGNETGVAGLVVYLTCLVGLVGVQAVLYVGIEVMAIVITGVRRAGGWVVGGAWAGWVTGVGTLVGVGVGVTALLSHMDQLLLVHFGLSLSTSLYAAVDALVLTPVALVTALFVDPEPAAPAGVGPSLLAGVLPALSESGHLIAVTAVVLAVQPLWWDRANRSQCAYQLSCSTLAVLAASLATTHFLTATSFPAQVGTGVVPLVSFPSASPLVSVSALQWALALGSGAAPVDSPLLQPVTFALYAFALLFIGDASMTLQSLTFVYAILVLCYLPHTVHRCVVSTIEAVMTVDHAMKRPDRAHVE